MNLTKKSILTAIAGLACIVFVSLLLLTVGAMPFHNLALWNYAAQIKKMPHPEGTERIAMNRSVGIYTGNGNHCDFLVLEIRSYKPDDKDSIKAFYDTLNTATYFTNEYESSAAKPVILFPNETKHWYDPYKYDWVIEAKLPSPKLPTYAIEHTHYYTSETFGDIRCT